MAANITTAVDSLVKLVNEKGRISLDDASKELGIPGNILNEWASFLDQEKIIHVEYNFTTPYLTSKERNDIKKNLGPMVDYEMIERKIEVIEARLIKEQPADEKKIKQKEYLLKEIKRLKELTKKKKITKEELEKLINFYNIFRLQYSCFI